MRRITALVAALSLVLGGCQGLGKSDGKVLAGLGVVAAGAAATVALTAKGHHDQHEAHKVSTCGDTPRQSISLDPNDWYIGPTLWDGPHSPGMPLHPAPHPSGIGFVIDFPTTPGSKVDYVTTRIDGLAGKSEISFTYELTLAPEAEVDAVPEPDKGDTGHYLAQITPHFQEANDDWSAAGKYETSRWYGYIPGGNYLQPGEHTVTISLVDGHWGATLASTRENNPAAFQAALANSRCLGFVFGGNGIGIGHGANATSPARLWMKRFEAR